MKRYVTDTQCLLWYMAGDRHLPRFARPVFRETEEGFGQILIPSIVLVEAIFLFQRQRVPGSIITHLGELSEAPDANFCVTSLNMAVVRALRDFGPAAVPELPDRIIAATARALDLPLITTDSTIAESGLITIVE